MKFSALSLLALASVANAGKSKSKPEPVKCPVVTNKNPANHLTPPVLVSGLHNYLVGLLVYKIDDTPDILNFVTSGTLLGSRRRVLEEGEEPASEEEEGRSLQSGPPYSYIPNTGVTELDYYYAVNSKTKTLGEFYALADNGYETSDKSEDYALHVDHLEIKKPFVYNHGGRVYEQWTPVVNKDTKLIHDPHKLIKWKSEIDGFDLDIQVEYAVPDDTWSGYKDLRVLTGRDLDPEGMKVHLWNCSLVADQYGPYIFAMDPYTGVVKSALVPIPDIVNKTTHLLSKKLLTTVSDKRHCGLHALQDNSCKIVKKDVIDKNGYFEYVKSASGKGKVKKFITKFKRINPDDGFVSLAGMDSGRIFGFFQKKLANEPGPRIYELYAGNCTSKCTPKVVKLNGFYPLSKNTNQIAAAAPIPGSDWVIAVLENNGFPSGETFPRATMPYDRVCIIDLGPESYPADNIGLDLVPANKFCVLDLLRISDPWGTGYGGQYAQTKQYNSGLIILDDYCLLGGTDPNSATSPNDYGVSAAETPFYVEAVVSTQYFIVCYYEPYFDAGFVFGAGARVPI